MQLDPEAAMEPMVRTLRDYVDDDWCHEDFPRVVAQLGQAGVPHAARLLADRAADEGSRMTSAVALTKVTEAFPSERDAVVCILAQALEAFELNGTSLNAVLVGELATLKAREHAGLIGRAFEAGRVDELLSESWEALRAELAQ